MLFNSLEFIVFFPIVIALYFAMPHRYRWVLLLGASYYFYMSWKVEYILIIIFSTIVDYFCGLKMEGLPDKASRKKFLYLSLGVNLSVLFIFKYLNFFSQSSWRVFDTLNQNFIGLNIQDNPFLINVLLPVGISFYTFQTLSYTIDVYNGTTKPERHFGKFALYVSFFPQLVAGPIERSSQLLPQFHKDYNIDYLRIRSGLLLMLWGFFKKVVIADRLSLYVNEVYNNLSDYEAINTLIATYFFAFQIYCDFSGYSDIAIGIALVMGYKLMVNFRRPYFAENIRNFWGRWHISLSTWFRDYVYIPLGGNRVVKWRWYYNLFVVFLVSGLWHGANWTFIIWGALHGIYQVIGITTAKWQEKAGSKMFGNSFSLKKLMHIFVTFHLVLFAWVFFRANNIGDAFAVFGNILAFNADDVVNIFALKADMTIAIIAIVFLILVDFMQERFSLRKVYYSISVPARWIFLILILVSIFVFGKFEEQDFLYFQF